MFGIIHDALEDFVIKLFGVERWNEILSKSKIDLKGASFLMHRNYDDRLTFKLIFVTSQELKLDIETILEALGSHFIKYAFSIGYGEILKGLGSNLHDFLANVDLLNEHLSHVYPGMKPVSIRVSHSQDGTMQLLYSSQRKGLAPFFKGIVVAVSNEIFRTEVIVNQLSSDDSTTLFEVINKSIDPNSDAFERIKTPFTDSSLSASPNNLFFSVETLCETLPFHFIFKRNFRIIQMGNSLKRFASNFLSSRVTKISFSDLFIISKPTIDLNFDSILTYSNHLFLLVSREEYIRKRRNSGMGSGRERKFSLTEAAPEVKTKLKLKGQMISLPAFDSILFLGSPKLENIEEAMQLELTMSDFPIYDQTGANLVLRSINSDNRGLIGKIDEAANHLKILEKKLKAEIGKNHKILHEIFPSKIARILVQNIKVDAEHFENATCLYSDIVSFTAMCSSLKPIDIIRLLNKLYIQFDNQTNYYGTFKVETIGDAYIVISGVPEPVEDHADRVVEMGLAMVHVTRTIISPRDGKHIEMRIGIHSGPCMAGVVGKWWPILDSFRSPLLGLAMPRYAVFGNTITLANKMESTGPFGMVHISEATKKCLKKDKYYFVETNIQHLVDFPTYIVAKLYEEYHEDHLVVENNLNMSGGLFKSPSSSPVHEAKKSTANQPAASRQMQAGFDFSRTSNNLRPPRKATHFAVPAIQISKPDNSK